MFLNIPLLEWIGYLASILVAISLTMSSIKKLRWLNLIGSAVFSFYGFSIGALPVGFLNLFIVLVNIYYLIRMNSAQESFKALAVEPNDAYFNYFIEFHKKEILQIFPHFELASTKQDKTSSIALLLLRNAVTAGVFYGTIDNGCLYVELDFVASEYRDLKPGEFIYKTNVQQLKEKGIHKVVAKSELPQHDKYLTKMGFVRRNDTPTIFEKEI
jgi:hypothetical protein